MNPKLLFSKLLFSTLLLVLMSMQTFAQNITVRGKVTGEDGSGMPGISVLLKGTTTGTNTDEKGAFIINNVSSNGTLVFSSIGFTTKEVAIGNRSTINVSLILNFLPMVMFDAVASSSTSPFSVLVTIKNFFCTFNGLD